MYFAINPGHSRVHQDALELLIAQTNEQQHWFALIDCAFTHGDIPTTKALKAFDLAPLYNTPPLDKLRDAGPALLALPRDQTARDKLLTRLLRLCHGKPMLSFICSKLSASALCEQWQSCFYPVCEDEQRFLLRFADTRISPVLAQALSASNWARFAAPLSQWCVIDRQGALASLTLPNEKPASVATNTEPLSLTMTEIESFLSHTQTDAVIAFLNEHYSDLLPQQNKAALYVQIAAVCALAARHTLESFPDLTSLALASCVTHGEIMSDPRLEKTLQSAFTPGQLGPHLVELMPEEIQK
jgi:hypothetical protein